ncbi:MAG: rhodanese-like domain-containing protein [Oscillospiraceae bacterium]|jgi:rhodanese-related sulfurtransferase|nr:rhodanese-like domain-containing protein [Oscillospiraceae bacterium]
MKKLILPFSILVAGGLAVLLYLVLSGAAFAPAAPAKTGSESGYARAAFEGVSEDPAKGESFLVCGTGGRLDRIYADKSVSTLSSGVETDLTSILAGSGITIVGGERGALLYSRDGETFARGASGVKSDILGLAAFKGTYYACTSGGEVLSSPDGVKWKVRRGLAANPLISIEANDDYMMAITAETDILVTYDGEEWTVSNFNTQYDGFYEKYLFTNMRNLGPTFFVLGQIMENPGTPIIMFTDNAGEVWMFKTLMEIDQKPPETYYPLHINDISVFTDQLIAVCNGGRVLTVTECPVCNTVLSASGADLRALAIGDTFMIAAGGGFEFAVLNNLETRQDTIKAEQALTDFTNGAVIIDVRTKEEYDEGHIKGCLHIPVDEIESRLAAEVPDRQTELIFYCKAGTRAQAAVEKAQQLGYQKVFNLGGLSDWPYDTE